MGLLARFYTKTARMNKLSDYQQFAESCTVLLQYYFRVARHAANVLSLSGGVCLMRCLFESGAQGICRMVPPGSNAIPTRFGIYEVKDFLGGGAFSQVYRGWDPTMSRQVAIVTRSTDIRSADAKRFIEYAAFVASLHHKNIISVVETGYEQGTYFRIEEFLDGEDLSTAIDSGRTGDLAYKLTIFLSIARALEYLHRRQILHRDFNPNAIHVCRDGTVKVFSFQLAVSEDARGHVGPMGIPQYIAPELFAGEPFTRATDVYALGVTGYELLSRSENSDIMASTWDRITQRTTVNLDVLHDTGIPSTLVDLIGACTLHTPSARKTVSDVVRDVELLLRDEAMLREYGTAMTTNVNGPVQPMPPLRVFLCHASDDKPNVRLLHQRLRAEGLKPWLDEEELLPGQDWHEAISKAVRSSDAVIVCLSKKSVDKTGYVQRELRLVLEVADEQPLGAIFLIPAKIEECEVPDRLRRWQWVDLHDENGHRKLIRALQYRLSTRRAFSS